MTWLGMAVILLLAVFGAVGYARGFIKEAVSMVSLVLSLGIVWLINPAVTSLVKDYTPFYTQVQEYCKESIEEKIAPGIEIGREAQKDLIDHLPLPDNMKEGLTANNNSEVYQLLSVDSFTDYVADYVSVTLTNGVGFLISFAAAFVAVKILVCTLGVVGNLPVVRGINRSAGAVIGLAKGLAVVWILGLAATVLCNTPMGKTCMEMIEKDFVLSFLYEWDIFVKVFANIFYGM